MSNIFEGHKFIKNQSLVLTDFQDVSVTGLFVGFNRDKSRLELQIVSDLRTKKFLGKIKFYYSSNVKNIQIMTPEQKVDIINEVLCPENTSISKFQQETIEKNIEKFALIQKTDERYHKAVQQLSAQPSIGLSWEGCENGRSTKLSMLALSTNTNIFIFDIIYLGNKVPKELKTVLKDTSICKVIHNALLLCDALFHSYDVEIANIFDTMLATSIYVSSEKNGSKVDACINKCLGISLNFDHKSTRYYTNIRPLPQEDQLHLSKTCGYLLFLYQFLVNKVMLKSFHTIVNDHCFATKSEPITNFGMLLQKPDFGRVRRTE